MKTLKFKIPDGYEVDKERSTFQEIVLKKIKRGSSLHLENDLLLFRYPEEVSNVTWDKLLRYRKQVLKEIPLSSEELLIEKLNKYEAII